MCTADSVGWASRALRDDAAVVEGTLAELMAVDFGAPLHSLVLLGHLNADEAELLGAFCPPSASAPAPDAKAAAAEDLAGRSGSARGRARAARVQ